MAVIFLVACEKASEKSGIPNIPINVPEESIWVGGLDGGVFVLVTKNESSKANEFLGQIYYISGDLAYKGTLYLSPEISSKVDFDDANTYQGWDGDVLYLINGMQLLIDKP
jgi:hypothetical protein